jgi:hypothetical protein
MLNHYDLIIVGGGIAGLRVGIESLKLNPYIKCCILEKYGYIGGRINTFRKDIPKVGTVQWENGAGRISIKHKKILKLLDDYKLTFIPTGGDTDFISESIPIISKNKFTDLIKIYLEPISKLSSETLATHTLKELLHKTIGPTSAKSFYEQFPYYSEIHTLRADIALNAFQNEMKSNEGFGICKEGLSSMTYAMMTEFINLGGTVIMDTEVYKIISNPDSSIILQCKVRNTIKKNTYTGKVTVLALHHNALKGIKGVNTLPVLNHLTMTPLLRIYAIFPTKGGVSWFSNLNKIVTNSPIRYIIPIDSSRGIIMISYTDGQDAIKWIKDDNSSAEHGEDNVKDLVMTEIKKLFPERTIPKPIFFKQHPWYDGCTYWLPGSYNVEEESRKSLHPLPESMPNLFMCSESFAVKQCWMESALEQADKLLNHDVYRSALRNT